jgi:hypothetical protein
MNVEIALWFDSGYLGCEYFEVEGLNNNSILYGIFYRLISEI